MASIDMLAPHRPPTGTVLVVDDDDVIRDLITDQLHREHQVVRSAPGAREARQSLATEHADVIVLDLNLPDGDGLELCRELHREGYAGSIIMLTARDAPIDRVLGLELGADDYLTKPFEPRELSARVRNLLRRMQPEGGQRVRSYRAAFIGPWRLDLLQRRLVGQDGRLVMLSSAEFRLLSHLMEFPNQPVSRQALAPERSATVSFDRTIDLQVSRLRQKLGVDAEGRSLILTVRNEGYMLAADIRFE